MNRLTDSSSLYLRQHAGNPVHWQPWDDAALNDARQSGRPILLSIGYSACHWCHVMAHESFEDPETAAVMNELFTCIKVDREERPDLDKAYQLAHQLLSGRGGGWPLTVFIHPDTLAPFFAGTYFPPAPRHGMPAFPEVLRRVRAWYDQSPDEVRELNGRVSDAIAAIQRAGATADAGPELLASAAGQALQQADRDNGGFGGAPKFPQAPLLEALPGLAAAEPGLLKHLDVSLDRMSRGGLRDQLDGGFYRYTVDVDWTIPHFEKMLYDNALLLPLYAEASARTGSTWLAASAAGIADWMTSELRQDNGGFSSSMDADADGREGGFHVWQVNEIKECLEAEEFQAARKVFGLDTPPNFEGEAWHLTRRHGEADPETLARAIAKLRAARSARVPPATDHKQLTAWNALCIDGFARAGLAMDRPDWLDSAETCLAFVTSRLWDGESLHAVYADGKAGFAAYLDDHAFLVQAALSLLQSRWANSTLNFACRLADILLEQFADEVHGGFFFTAERAEAPMHRLRTLQDDATPSGNGIAALALLRLGHLCTEPRYVAASERLLGKLPAEVSKYPLGHASLLRALYEYLDPPAQVIITGPNGAERDAWKAAARSFDRVHCYSLDPRTDTCAAIPDAERHDESTRAHVCLGMRCLPAAASVDEMTRQLRTRD